MTARLLPVGVFVILFRETLEADPFYSDIWLEGEVSDLSRSAAGHTYFTLRDDDGALKCVLFRNQALRQHQLPRIGESVAVHGGLSIYPRSGSVQLVIDLVRPVGLGAAHLELDYLRDSLAAEGLFAPEHKRALPAWPRAIGVVTSSYGAAWHDIQTVIGRRFPLTALVLSPAKVQGLGAPESIVAALQRIQSEPSADLVILARGGGDSDDLSAFNDERVVRAVFACRVPVVAGIGHATDQTLVEEVADAYAATPSAAAEIAVPSLIEITDHLDALSARLAWSFAARRGETRAALDALARRLDASAPRLRLHKQQTELNALRATLERSTQGIFGAGRQRAEGATRHLELLDPHAVLERGYAALSNPATGQAIVSTTQVSLGLPLAIALRDGRVRATPIDVEPYADCGAPQ